MSFNRKEENYTDTPPGRYSGSLEEWLDLSYDMQYYWCERKESQKEYNRKRIDEISSWVDNIKSKSGCVVCDIDDPVVLDFHHIDKKNVSVGDLVSSGAGRDKISEEIEKCVVVCANCHRRHHAENIDIMDHI